MTCTWDLSMSVSTLGGLVGNRLALSYTRSTRPVEDQMK